jgi:hypothetical protein
MPSGGLPRLRYNESDAVVAVSDQIMVAKEKTRAQRRSDDAEFGKDWFYRRVKNGPGQRLKINLKAAPGVLFAPLQNGVTLPRHCRFQSSADLPKANFYQV